jgi:hypothetical protein
MQAHPVEDRLEPAPGFAGGVEHSVGRVLSAQITDALG